MDSLAGELPVLAVGFDGAGDPERPGPWFLDEGRALYRRLGTGRAPWWRVWSPGTLAFYARTENATAPEATPPDATPPDAAAVDTRQMGADAVVVGGVVVRRWLPRTPVDRVAPEVVVAVARGLG